MADSLRFSFFANGSVPRIFSADGDLSTFKPGLVSLSESYLNLVLGDYIQARDGFEQSLKYFREADSLTGQSWVLSFLGLLYHQVLDDDAALVYDQQALRITQEIGSRVVHAHALTFQAHSLVRLNKLDQAAGSYEYAYALCDELSLAGLRLDNLAGQARLAYIQNQSSQALAIVGQMLNLINLGFLDLAVEPARLCLTSYIILKSLRDSRAIDILNFAHDWLLQKAGQLESPSRERLFLENISAHRILLQIWLENNNKPQ